MGELSPWNLVTQLRDLVPRHDSKRHLGFNFWKYEIFSNLKRCSLDTQYIYGLVAEMK